jgi:FMN-dependent NADH-azoreductase
MKLLHIDSSARGTHSVSRQLSADIVAELKRQHAGVEVTYRDLNATALPHWAPVADASHPDAIVASEVMEEFLAADLVVIGAPMYNFNISSSLKAWLDRVMVAGKTFRYGPNGPEGLAGGKQVIIASSRGGIYSSGPRVSMDFQEPYLRAALGFIGIADPQFVRAEGLAMGEEVKAKAFESARAAIAALTVELAEAA